MRAPRARRARAARRAGRGLRRASCARWTSPRLPGVAETIDWTQALVALGEEELGADIVDATLGSVLKYHEDLRAGARRRTSRALVEAAKAPPVTARPRDHSPPGDAVVRKLVTFGRILREAGVEVGPGRLQDALLALDAIDLVDARRGLLRRCAARWSRGATTSRSSTAPSPRSGSSGRRRATSSQRPIDLGLGSTRSRSRRCWRATAIEPSSPGEDAERRPTTRRTAAAACRRPTSCCASATSRLWPATSCARARALVRAVARSLPRRSLAAARAGARGPARSTRGARCGEAMRTGGEPIERAWRQPKLVSAAARLPGRRLRLDGALRARAGAVPAGRGARTGRHVEAFTFGTRLTRLTPHLDGRDPDRALDERRAGGARLGRRHAHRREPQRLQRRLGPARDDARRDRRDRLRRLGARRSHAAGRADGAPAPPPTASSGSTRWRAARATGRWSPGWQAALPYVDVLPARPQPARARDAGRGSGGVDESARRTPDAVRCGVAHE